MTTRTVNLGSIARITSGGTPDRENPTYWGGTVPWVKTTLVQNCEICLEEIDEKITEAGLKSSSAKLIPAGSILLAMVGQGKTRGQVAILTTDAAINQNCAAIIPNGEAHNRYVYQQLLFRYEEIRKASNSSGQQNLNAGLIRELRMPLPRLPEQEKIAGILAVWDTAIQKIEQLIEAQELRLAWTLRRLYEPKPHWTASSLGAVLAPIKRLHGNGNYDIGSVGKRGIRLRSEIYSKNLSATHVGNILVEPGWVCFGLSTDSISYGVNRTSRIYSVSPAYRTYEIKGADSGYIDGHLRAFNAQLSKRFLIISARQGKAIDFDGLLNARCHFPPIAEQQLISKTLTEMQGAIEKLRDIADRYKAQKRGLMQMLLTGTRRLPAKGKGKS